MQPLLLLLFSFVVTCFGQAVDENGCDFDWVYYPDDKHCYYSSGQNKYFDLAPEITEEVSRRDGLKIRPPANTVFELALYCTTMDASLVTYRDVKLGKWLQDILHGASRGTGTRKGTCDTNVWGTWNDVTVHYPKKQIYIDGYKENGHMWKFMVQESVDYAKAQGFDALKFCTQDSTRFCADRSQEKWKGNALLLLVTGYCDERLTEDGVGKPYGISPDGLGYDNPYKFSCRKAPFLPGK